VNVYFKSHIIFGGTQNRHKEDFKNYSTMKKRWYVFS